MIEKNNLENILYQNQKYEKNIFTKLEEKLRSDKSLMLTGLTHNALAHLVFQTSNLNEKPAVIIVENEIIAKEVLNTLDGYTDNAAYLEPKEYRNFDVIAQSREKDILRMKTLRDIERNNVSVLVVSVNTLMQKMIPKDKLFENILSFKIGKEYDLENIIQTLVAWGYRRKHSVEEIGSFALKGGILDIALNEQVGTRIEFWGDEIESIRDFNLITQRSIKKRNCLEIYPAYENINIDKENVIESLKSLVLKKENANIKEEIFNDIKDIEEDLYYEKIEKYFNFFYPKADMFLDYIEAYGYTKYIYEPELCDLRLVNIKRENNLNLEYFFKEEKYIPKYMLSDIQESINIFRKEILENKKNPTIYSIFSKVVNIKKIKKDYETLDVNIREIEYLGDYDKFNKLFNSAYKENKKIILLTQKYKELALLLSENNIESIVFDKIYTNQQIADILDVLNSTPDNKVLIFKSNLNHGIIIEQENILFLGFNKTSKKIKRKERFSYSQGEDYIYTDLEEGDLVVHRINGIGRFVEINQIEVLGVKKEYLKIEYRDGDFLYVPISSAESIRKYIGDSSDNIKLNKLGGKEWEKTTNRVKNNLREIADDLINLYAQRDKAKGHAFSKDTNWQKQFEESFEYQETEDQLKCIIEIKKDMEDIKPMDRLLCGDVGFGKTEVAMRAAFKAVTDGKQVAYLAPTTILVRQQYMEFKERMKDFPINIDFMSRLKTPIQNKKTIEKLKNAEIDIVIGTHRLLSKDVNFKDLGLLIIDEEHRFGVQAKEKIKFLKKQIDVLAMTATPIPRTMQMSLSGIRDLSVIYDPPQNRKSIQTYLIEYDENLIKEAIIKEIEREGQVFYIHNRVETIARKAKELQEQMPNIKIGYAHGQMSGKMIDEIMSSFVLGNIDVLVCTTILESGIDVPNANTMIIDEADRLGLAQLYQIRGRVGRSNKQAYAYLTFKKNKQLSETAQQRLQAIRDFTELGSGMKIAMRDLEIRGAGSILGEIQHGHLAKVGYDMYFKLLNEVIAERKGEHIEEEKEVLIDLNIESYIPHEYIESEKDRIDVYQNIAYAKKEKDYVKIKEELEDRFGKIPKQILKLFLISQIKNIAKIKNIDKIIQKGKYVYFYLEKNFKIIDPTKILEKHGKNINISKGKEFIKYLIDVNGKNDIMILNELKEFIYDL